MFVTQISQYQQMPVRYPMKSVNGQKISWAFRHHGEIDPVGKGRVGPQNQVQTADVVHLIIGTPPVQRRGPVDIDLGVGKPFYPVGESKSAMTGCQGTQGSA